MSARLPRALVLVEADELRQLIVEAVRAAVGQQASTDDWVDARTSGLGRGLFRRLVRDGTLPTHKRGKTFVVRRSEVDAYIQSQRVPAAAPRVPIVKGVAGVSDPIAAALAEGRLRLVKKPP